MKPSEFTDISKLFKNVAAKYDLMNDIMSFGIHRIWKYNFVNSLNINSESKVLDLACGTGDIALSILKKYKLKHIDVADLQPTMLEKCSENLINAGHLNFTSTVANANNLPYPDNTFDCITISFGFRNFIDFDKCVKELYRVIVPGGRLEILEFSKPAESIQPVYELFLQQIPKVSEFIVNDKQSYQYLIDSIKAHPDQDSFKAILLSNGFQKAYFTNHSFGIAATHTAIKSC